MTVSPLSLLPVRLALVFALAGSAPAWAQDAKPPAEQKPAEGPATSPTRAVGPLVPLDVQVVVTRYQGEKKVSSLPYALAVNANDRATSSIRMVAQVPVQSGPLPRDPTQKPSPFIDYNYQNVGTNIDCLARTMDDGRFQVNITVEDSWVYENVTSTVAPSVSGRPVMRSFRSTNTLVMRDGQSRQFTTATDRVNGEVVRIEVTLRVVK